MSKETTIKDQMPWLKGELKFEHLKDIYFLLESYEFPESAKQTGKISSGNREVTGYKSQYVINALNEIVGINHWNLKTIDFKEGEKGNVVVFSCDAVLEFGNYVEYKDEYNVPHMKFMVLTSKENTGGCNNMSRYEAKKGARTNVLKKLAAMYGLGRKAFEGSMDEDIVDDVVYEEIKESSKEVPTVVISSETKKGKEALNKNDWAEMLTKFNDIRSKDDLEKFVKGYEKIKPTFSEAQVKLFDVQIEKKKKEYENI